MAEAVRVIPCLDVDAGRVVKGVKFQGLQDAGDPVELASRYTAEGADEITFLDVSASAEGRGTTLDVVRATAAKVTVPLTVGGGIRSVTDVAALLDAGASKVSVSTAAVDRPELIDEVASRFGSDVVILSMDVLGQAPTASGFEVTTMGGRNRTGRDAVEWAEEAAARGVGEILLNSIDGDGTRDGYDLELLRAVRGAVTVPLIASGGAGEAAHFTAAVEAGANAVLAASVFHFGTLSIAEVKAELTAAGITVR
ncbi:MAG TPA: imidazole glycerol phosphate synthase subunit HisF [Actinomycetaceae bacterium]|nr:imidazole glycerol phosphate synthase subunit HisF [Actinomycetaceae bacterium]